LDTRHSLAANPPRSYDERVGEFVVRRLPTPALLRCLMMSLMTRRFTIALLLVVSHTLLSASAKADPAGSLFDPARHMRVSEVRPGMKGYGLSVFLGTKIERFDVEVISVLKNFNPKTDVVLIKFGGDNLEHNLAIAGMSGSPIYLYDDTGKARMIGRVRLRLAVAEGSDCRGAADRIHAEIAGGSGIAHLATE